MTRKCPRLLGPVLLTACASTKHLLALNYYSQDLLKTRSDKLALKRRVRSYFYAWPYWICICGSFPFRCNIYGRRGFKWITQHNLLTFALIKLLVFAPLFNAQKACLIIICLTVLSKCLTILCLRWLQLLLLGGGTSENREHVLEGRGFFPHALIYLECHKENIIQTYHLSSHVIFNLLQDIKDDLEPSTRSHTILLATLNFLASGSFQHTVPSLFILFFICDYANLRCAWYIALVDM